MPAPRARRSPQLEGGNLIISTRLSDRAALIIGYPWQFLRKGAAYHMNVLTGWRPCQLGFTNRTRWLGGLRGSVLDRPGDGRARSRALPGGPEAVG